MNAKELLKINFDSNTFRIRANSIFDKVIENTIKASLRRIDDSTRKFNEKDFGIALPDVDPEKLFKVLKQKFDAKVDCEMTKTELRVISFNLHLVEENSNFASYIVEQFNKKWSNLYIFGLLDYVCKEWDFNNKAFSSIYKELIERVKAYDGAILRILSLKENINCLQDGMPEKLGYKLTVDGKSPKDLPAYIGLAEHHLPYKYFSGAIISYYKIQAKGSFDFDETMEVLRIHNNPYTDKVVLSMIVNNYTPSSNISENRLINATKNRIGSYNNVFAWKLSNAPEDIKDMVERARCKIKLWQNKKLIESFFDAFVADGSKRKSFWLGFVGVIDDIKIFVANSEIKAAEYDQKKKDALSFGYSIVNKRRTSAFVMRIGRFRVIEFSDTGALHVYHQNEEINKMIKKTSISDVSELKDGSLPMLVEEDWYYNDEGRLFHSGRWRHRLSTWLYKKGFISAWQIISEYEDDLY